MTPFEYLTVSALAWIYRAIKSNGSKQPGFCSWWAATWTTLVGLIELALSLPWGKP